MPQTASIDPVVAENLKTVMRERGRSAYSVAQALGVSSNWLYRIVNMDRGIMLPTLRQVAYELGVSVGELVDPPGESGVSSGRHNPQGAIAETRAPYDNYRPRGRRPIEILEVASAAGSGTEVYDETPVGVLWFREGWLKSHSIDPEQSNIISVRGGSMEPTLPDGCSILVDRERREPHEGRIYVMRTEDGLVVKRLGLDDDGRWEIRSDNPDWEPSLMLYGTEIIGEIRWSARTF